MNVDDAPSFFSAKGLKGDLNPDLCDSGAVLYQLSHQANWKLVVICTGWVNKKPIDDG